MKISRHVPLGLFISTLAGAQHLPGLFEALNNNGASEFAALLQSNARLLDAAISGQLGTIFAPLDSHHYVSNSSSNSSSSSPGYPRTTTTTTTRAALNATEEQIFAYQLSSATKKWGNLTQPTLEGVIDTLLDDANLGDGKTQAAVFTLLRDKFNPPDKDKDKDNGNNSSSSSDVPYAEISTGLGNTVTILTPYIEFMKCGLLEYGYIHIVDGYFTLPQLLSDTLAQIPELSTFRALLDTSCSCLKSKLDTTPSLTLFIPTNEAFAAAGITSDQENLAGQLEGLVVSDFVGYTPMLAEDIGGIGTLISMNGSTLQISATDIAMGPTKGQKQEIWVNEAKIIKRNIILRNGVAHILDSMPYVPVL